MVVVVLRQADDGIRMEYTHNNKVLVYDPEGEGVMEGTDPVLDEWPTVAMLELVEHEDGSAHIGTTLPHVDKFVLEWNAAKFLMQCGMDAATAFRVINDRVRPLWS